MTRKFCRMGKEGVLTTEVYTAIVQHLSANTRPTANERKRSALQNKIYKCLNGCDYDLQRVHDPRSVDQETRLVLTGTNLIVLREEEVEELIIMYFNHTKGANAKKIHGLIAKHFSGVGEKRIQACINGLRKSQELHPKFLNKAPLIPALAGTVQHSNQLDLVDFSDMAIEVDVDGLTYKYVLCVLDVFSR